MTNRTRIAAGVALIGTMLGGYTVAAGAQELRYNPSLYVMPQVMWFNPDNQFGTEDKGPGAGLKFGKAINQWFDVQVGGSYARVDGNSPDVRYQQTTLGIDGLYMLSRDRFRPFLLLGIGAENDRRNIPNRQNSRTSPYAAAGLGFQYVFADQWAGQVDFRRVFGFQRSDIYGTDRRTQNNYASIGLTYFFDKTPTQAPRVAAPAPAPAPVAQVAPPAPPPPPPPPRFERQTMSATELFAFDSANLRQPQPQPKLDEIAAVLQRNPQVGNVRITGHTDRLGSDAYNQRLSQRRADAVKTYLVGKGVGAERLTTIGKGESEPVVQCSEKNRAALIKCLEPNRRVDVEDVTIERRVQ